MSRCFLFDGAASREFDIGALPDALHSAIFLWVHIDGATDDADAIAGAVGTLPAVVRSALSASETRPRATAYDNGALLNMRGLGAEDAGDGDALVSIRLWAEQGRVVSLSYRPLSAFGKVVDDMLAARLRDPGDLITALATEITEELDPDIAELGDELDSIESQLSDNGSVRMRHQVTLLRAAAISYRRFLAPQRQMMERLIGLPCTWLDASDRLHLQEAADRCSRMVEELEAVRERAALAHEALTDLRAEHMNQQALILAVVALVFLPLTFLTGLLGMNVEGIPYASRPWAFWGVTFVCAAIAGGLGLWFKLTRWLR